MPALCSNHRLAGGLPILAAVTVLSAAPVAFLHGAVELELDWRLRPGDVAWLTSDNAQRGLAYNAATDSVLVVSRAGGGNDIHVIDAADGSERHSMDVRPVFGGFFPLNKVGVGDDGAVYAANMTLNAATSLFTVYRWDSDSPDAEPTVVYQGDPGEAVGQPGERWGDTFDVQGAGAATRFLAASNTSSTAAVFTTTDGMDFEATAFTGVADGDGALGVAFGPGESFYTKKGSATLRLVSFDLAMGTSSVEPITSSTLVRVLGSRAAGPWLGTITLDRTAAGLGTAPDVLTLLNITNPSVPTSEATAPLVVDTEEGVAYDFDNPNGAGAVAFAENRAFILSTNSGIFGFSISDVGNAPPTINNDPADVTILEGGIARFEADASGDPPLAYQWTFAGGDIEGATDAVLEVGPVDPDAAGGYAVRVSNNAGSATSGDATLTVQPRFDGAAGTLAWSVPAGSRPYLSESARTHRGAAVSPATGNVVVVSRELGKRVYVLDGTTGADLHELDTTGVDGGIFALNMIGVAEDGAIYAGNLTLNGTSSAFTLYRWADETAGVPPSVAFSGDPAAGLSEQRWGDTLDVRGSGASTQVLLGSRAGTEVSVLTTVDGLFFDAVPITTDGDAGDFGLGIAFGEGDTAWGSSAGRGLRRVAFDLGLGTGTTTHLFPVGEFPGSATAIDVDPALGCLAAVVLDSPNTLQLFDISDLGAPPVRLDQELFNDGRANANTDGTGAVAFGNGIVAGLATNHGVLQLDLAKSVPVTPPRIGPITLLPPDRLVFDVFGEPDASFVVELSPDLVNWTEGESGTLDADGEAGVVVTIDGLVRFARVVQTVE